MSTAVLFSAGLDSAVLLAEEARSQEVQPIYMAAGLAWEASERAAMTEFLQALSPVHRVRPVVTLGVDMTDVYAMDHWAVQGEPPAYHTDDRDVYLPGRNIVLLAKAAVYCASAAIGRIAIGTLDHNPFPDATPAFRAAMGSAVSIGLAHGLTIDAPYASLSKSAVVRKGMALGVPLALTLSCMKKGAGRFFPAAAAAQRARPLFLHCGVCSKCRERHDAFVGAGVEDPTDYADRRHVGAGPGA
jgi:7-cyano-7-deazaguanine synthase